MSKLIRYLKFIIPAGCVLVLVSAIFFAPRVIVINAIACETQFGPCVGEFAQKFDQIDKKSYKDTKLQIEALLATNASIDKYLIKFLFPDKIKVSMIVKKATYGVVGVGGQVALIDQQGLVLGYQNQTLLPVIKISQNPPHVGDEVNEDTLFATKILGYMNSIYQIKEGKLDSSELTFRLKDGPNVIFPIGGDERVLVGKLILISGRLNNKNDDMLSRLNNLYDKTKIVQDPGIEGCKIGCEIDLRYKNPVIRI